MARVRALVNNVPVKAASTSITREGERATDQSKVLIYVD